MGSKASLHLRDEEIQAIHKDTGCKKGNRLCTGHFMLALMYADLFI